MSRGVNVIAIAWAVVRSNTIQLIERIGKRAARRCLMFQELQELRSLHTV